MGIYKIETTRVNGANAHIESMSFNTRDIAEQMVRSINEHSRDTRAIFIEPEPKFKVGDWVTSSFDEYTNAFSVTRSDRGTTSMTNFGKLTEVCRQDAEVKLWQPKEGEWCWFWNTFSKNAPTLSRLYGLKHYKEYSKFITTHTKRLEFDNCEPFIGTLPTRLQET